LWNVAARLRGKLPKLVTTDEQHSAIIKFYDWAVRLTFLFALVFLVAFLAKKAGISFPWDVLTHFIR